MPITMQALLQIHLKNDHLSTSIEIVNKQLLEGEGDLENYYHKIKPEGETTMGTQISQHEFFSYATWKVAFRTFMVQGQTQDNRPNYSTRRIEFESGGKCWNVSEYFLFFCATSFRRTEAPRRAGKTLSTIILRMCINFSVLMN